MDLPKELIDFRNWCQRNTIPKNFDTLDMLLMHYKKSINCGQTETQAVRQNEQQKEYWFCSPNCDLDPSNDCEECKINYEKTKSKPI